MERRYCTWDMNVDISFQFQQLMNTLIETLIKPETLKRELFFALLLAMIKENGFVLKENTKINIVEYILSKRADGSKIYEVDIILSMFPDTPAKVLASPLTDTMLVNVIIPEINSETYSLCLKTSEYIIINSLGIPSKFSNLDDLFFTLKNKIAVPVKSLILNWHNQPSCTLYGLPNDMIFQILISLPLSDILNLSESCKRLRRVIEEESLWSQLCKRDFSKTLKDDNTSWQNTYKELCLHKQRNILKPSTDDIRGIVDEVDEWPDYLRPVRDSPWDVIFR